MKIKDLVNIKTLIITIIFFIGVGTAFAGFLHLPKRVKVVEKKITDNTVTIGKVAQHLELFVREQRTIQKSQDRREELMLKLIEQK